MPRLLQFLASVAAVVSIVAAAVLVVDERPGEHDHYAKAHESLCAVADLIAADRREAAATLFHDEAHDALHRLAAAVEDRDRPLAARLLEAKRAVEELLAGDGAAEPVAAGGAGQVRQLAAVAAASARIATGRGVSSCD